MCFGFEPQAESRSSPLKVIPGPVGEEPISNLLGALLLGGGRGSCTLRVQHEAFKGLGFKDLRVKI